MSFLDKFMFWKKKDDFDFGSGLDTGMGNSPSGAFGSSPYGNNNSNLGSSTMSGSYGDMGIESGVGNSGGFSEQVSPERNNFSAQNIAQQQFQSPFQQPQQLTQPPQHFQQQYPPQSHSNTEIEIISSKLESIKALLESVNQRLTNLERIANGEYEPRRRNW